MKHFVRAMLILAPLAHAGTLQQHQGRWLGAMKTADGITLRLGADLFTRADGSYWASVASPDQGALDIPVRRISETPDGVELDVGFAAMHLRWNADHFDAEFRQDGTPTPLTLRKVAEFPSAARTQTPRGPFPYDEQTLAIASADGVTLGATLTLPQGKASGSVVVLVHGSGPQTRDSAMFGHRPFAVLADYLARRGIAVLRYDKRGIARSSGTYEQHTLPDLANDLGAVVKALKARRQFGRVGLVAFSEGPEVAAMVAARDPHAVDFIVALAGTGLDGLNAVVLQDRVYAQDKGASPADVARLQVYVRQWYGIIKAQPDAELRIGALKALVAGLAPQDKALVEKYEMNVGTLSYQWAAMPFLRASLMSDPRAHWRKVRCPVLALNGSLDHQVPLPENLAGLVDALHEGGNRKVESAILPSLNHLFQTARTGREDEYPGIAETLAPAAMEKIAAFVQRQRAAQ